MKEQAKILAVWGSPHSGKTTFATKLASAIYDSYKTTVIVLYPDLDTPTLPILFPTAKPEELGSVGVPLSAIDLEMESILTQLVSVKKRENLCYIGYRAGENRFTYPRYSKAKAEDLLDKLCELADYVIVDCPSMPDGNLLAASAIERADQVLSLATPDLSSMSFYLSQLPLFSDPEKIIQGMNVVCEDVFLPIEEAKAHFKDLRFTVPYSKEVREQSLSGKLSATVSDKSSISFLMSVSLIMAGTARTATAPSPKPSITKPRFASSSFSAKRLEALASGKSTISGVKSSWLSAGTLAFLIFS